LGIFEEPIIIKEKTMKEKQLKDAIQDFIEEHSVWSVEKSEVEEERKFILYALRQLIEKY